MLTLRLILKILPWILAVVLAMVLAVFLYTSGTFSHTPEQTIITQNTVLHEIEALGKLELVRYNFKDITELEKKGKDYFSLRLFRVGNAKLALVSVGSATGCIDLTKIRKQDIQFVNDTSYIRLPAPELCHYKLDMEKTHIYSYTSDDVGVDQEEFIQEGYRLAEQRIKDSALESGILDQTVHHSELILRPLLERITGNPVVFTYQPPATRLPETDLK